eukprot:sb/3462650/
MINNDGAANISQTSSTSSPACKRSKSDEGYEDERNTSNRHEDERNTSSRYEEERNTSSQNEDERITSSRNEEDRTITSRLNANVAEFIPRSQSPHQPPRIATPESGTNVFSREFIPRSSSRVSTPDSVHPTPNIGSYQNPYLSGRTENAHFQNQNFYPGNFPAVSLADIQLPSGPPPGLQPPPHPPWSGNQFNTGVYEGAGGGNQFTAGVGYTGSTGYQSNELGKEHYQYHGQEHYDNGRGEKDSQYYNKGFDVVQQIEQFNNGTFPPPPRHQFCSPTFPQRPPPPDHQYLDPQQRPPPPDHRPPPPDMRPPPPDHRPPPPQHFIGPAHPPQQFIGPFQPPTQSRGRGNERPPQPHSRGRGRAPPGLEPPPQPYLISRGRGTYDEELSRIATADDSFEVGRSPAPPPPRRDSRFESPDSLSRYNNRGYGPGSQRNNYSPRSGPHQGRVDSPQGRVDSPQGRFDSPARHGSSPSPRPQLNDSRWEAGYNTPSNCGTPRSGGGDNLSQQSGGDNWQNDHGNNSETRSDERNWQDENKTADTDENWRKSDKSETRIDGGYNWNTHVVIEPNQQTGYQTPPTTGYQTPPTTVYQTPTTGFQTPTSGYDTPPITRPQTSPSPQIGKPPNSSGKPSTSSVSGRHPSMMKKRLRTGAIANPNRSSRPLRPKSEVTDGFVIPTFTELVDVVRNNQTD